MSFQSLLFILFISATHSSLGQDLSDSTLDTKEDSSTKELPPIDQLQRDLSLQVFRITNSVDQFFINHKELDKDNGTRIHIYNINTLVDGKGYKNQFKFQAQWQFPRLNKRFSLAVENLKKNIHDRTLVNDSFENLKNEDSAEGGQAGVDYVQNKKIINFKISGRIKDKEDPHIYLKGRAFRDFSWKSFEFNTSLTVDWDERDQFSQSFYFDINKTLNSGHLLRWVNQQEWKDLNSVFRTNFGPTFFYKVSEKNFISYYLSCFGSKEHSLSMDSYRTGVSYRRQFYKKWAFIEVAPSIDWSRANDFKPKGSLVLKLETIIGEF